MVLNKLKDRRTTSGFTLVELLIVIVVIAILAAITIVSYGNISARAKTTQGATAAANTAKVAEAINADNSSYPMNTAAIVTGSTSTKLPSGIGIAAATTVSGTLGSPTVTLSTTKTANAGSQNVAWQTDGNVVAVLFTCGTGVANGGAIYYWDFSTGARSTTITYFGGATSTSSAAANC